MNIKRSVSKRLRRVADLLAPPPKVAAAPAPVAEVVAEPVAAPVDPIGRFRYAVPNPVETETSPDKLSALLAQTSRTWAKLGEEAVHWSVLSSPQFLPAHLDEAAFYATGVDDVMVLESFFQRAGVKLPLKGAALELGCGVGRVTIPLASKVDNVIAFDVSPPHLAVAQRAVDSRGISNVSLSRITTPDDIARLPTVSLFYSVIVLQHNPPPVAKRILELCLDRVAPGGFAFFQIPTYCENYRFSVDDYVPDELGRMEMHVLPQKVVFDVLHQRGFVPLDVHEDQSVGSHAMLSQTFFAQRRA